MKTEYIELILKSLCVIPTGYGIVGFRNVVKGETYITNKLNIAVAEFDEPTCPRPILSKLEVRPPDFFEDIE